MVSGQPGKLTPTDRASVVVHRPDRGDGAPIVRYAHERCAPSDVIETDTPNLVDPGSVWPAQAWLRPHGDPRPVVLVGPRMQQRRLLDRSQTDHPETIRDVLTVLFGVAASSGP